MRETSLIVVLILVAFLLSGLTGIIIGASFSPTTVFAGAAVLAIITVILIVAALWKQRGP